MNNRADIVPVILSGGSGTRLWPLSRPALPKQLLPLAGAETMLEATLRRAPAAEGFAPPLIVGNARHAEAIDAQAAAAGVHGHRLLLEPEGRNTAPAIALAALGCPPDALLLVMPSDHLVRSPAAFLRAVDRAAPAARAGALVTFGIEPDRPATGYGYIELGEELAPGVHRARRFVEKPDRPTAIAFLASGAYAWNGGIFLFRARRVLEELARHQPDVLRAAEAAMDAAERPGAGGRALVGAAAFRRSPAISIDYAVMERAAEVAVVPVDMGWSDVGSWDALHEVEFADEAGNAQRGDVVAIDGHNCLLRSDGPLIAALGVSNLIVVATPDAVLVVPRGRSEEVKTLVERLTAGGHPATGREVV